MKQTLAFLLTAAMLFGMVSMLPAPAWAAEEVASGTGKDGLSWTLDADGLLTISGQGEMTSCGWWDYYDQIKSVVVEYGVTSIGTSTFYGCSSLTEITIPGSVTSIGDMAFYRCSKLTEITIPSSVTSIGEHVFDYCYGLTEITIPASVTCIAAGAFACCPFLKNMTADEGNTVYYSQNNCIIEIATGILVAGCNSSVIPTDGSVVAIGAEAFYGCSFQSINIPDSVTSIGAGAFNACQALTECMIPASVTSIGVAAFAWTPSLELILVDEENTTYHSQNNCLIETATGILAVGCKNSSIPTDGSVTAIGDYAFYGCYVLTEIPIPSTVTCIGIGAFDGCSSLMSITFPDSVTCIGDGAFQGCSSLVSITIPEGVTSIGEYTFNGCSSLTSVWIPHSVTAIGDGAFSDCYELKNISIPDGVTTIGDWAFSDCYELKNVSIPDGVTTIGCGAFYHSGLEEIVIPSSMTSIGEMAFFECTKLISITIPDSVTSIEGGAFYGCSSLTEITIPSTVTVLVDWAFEGCTGLTSITFLGAAPELGEDIFAGVTANAYYPDNDATWTADVMQDYGGYITWIPYEAEAHEHSYEATVTAPTCTEGGYTTYTCECGHSYVADEVAALGHSEVVDASKAATCTEDGLTEGKHCDRCGEVLVAQEEIPAAGHSYVDGTCERCGALEVEPGDVVGDGDGINIMDVSAILSVAMGMELPEGFHMAAGDMDGDGLITTMDVFKALSIVLDQG